MIEFILNNENVNTELPTGSILLDFIRKEKLLVGTKIGCREGDCGACTVLVGTLMTNGKVVYKSILSCLTPIANIAGKHVVTIEGLNLKNNLTAVQNAVKENNATQCGFCTPGFVVSLTGYAFNNKTSIKGIRDSISGNICRCTGYKSIEKAAADISNILDAKDKKDNIEWLISNKFIPEYFKNIPERLSKIKHQTSTLKTDNLVGGGTDIYVRNANTFQHQNINITSKINELHKISVKENIITIGAGVTATELLNSSELQQQFPNLDEYFKLISSNQIRNMGTLGGNIVNASPIADLSILFIALNAKVNILGDKNNRIVSLHSFFKAYKTIDLKEGEIIKELSFNPISKSEHINFEKVSKRTHLDIASVNSAIRIKVEKDIITDIYISAGGVSPIPLLLKNTCNFLRSKKLNAENIRKASCVLKEEISPISDVRGTSEYKKLLIKQLYYTHFIKLFPKVINTSDIK